MKRATSLVVMCGAIAVPAIVVGGGFTQAIQKAGSTYELQVTGRAGVPADADAVVLNITSADAKGTGFVSAYPCGTARPNASNLNYGVGAPIANSAIVKIGTGGKVCLFTADSDTQLIADVNGWFPATSGYTSTSPMRLLDTRPGLTTVDDVAASDGIRTAGDDQRAAGDRSGRCARQRRRRGAQRDICRSPRHRLRHRLSVWLDASERVEPQLRRRRTGRQLGDRQGRHRRQGVPVHRRHRHAVDRRHQRLLPGRSGYTSTSPARVLDTRPGQTHRRRRRRRRRTPPRRPRSTSCKCAGRAGVPADATAVVLNITSAEARGTGFATAYPCGESRPTASNLNYGVGAPVANSAIVKVGTGGKVCLFTADTDTQLIADVNGWFTAGYNSIVPVRLLDTRSDDVDGGGGGAPAGADFYADFNSPGQLQSKFRHGLWRRDDTLIDQTEWPADHSLTCSTPDQKRTVHRSNPDESFYECAKHLMMSEGDTSGYSIAWVSPNQTFSMSGAASVCWEVNLTDMARASGSRSGSSPSPSRTCLPTCRSPRRSQDVPKSSSIPAPTTRSCCGRVRRRGWASWASTAT